jgi:oligogalacturonide lyase
MPPSPHLPCLLAASVLAALVARPAAAQSSPPAAAPAADAPREWIDPDTGHRIRRLTDEPNSTGFYFNINAFTPDGKKMVYNAPDGIHALDLASGKSTRVVESKAEGELKTIMVGRKTPTIFYTRPKEHALYAANVDTGEIRKLADLPPRANVATINADETLAGGTFIEGDGKDYGEDRVMPAGQSGPLVQPLNKGQMMEERLAAKLPMTLFTVDLKSGKQTPLLQHDTNWLNHLLFSPTDPALLMYCHEGPWQKVDRIWTIRTDGSHNQLMHRRTMAMEIAGHEFWGLDGKTVWYDLQTPKGEDFFLAGINVESGEKRWYHLQRNEWSIHFNVTPDEQLFCGDGGDRGQVARAPDGMWIQLFRPELIRVAGENDKSFVQPGVFRSERLVNMSKHNYKLEPNVRFSPDQKSVLFTANMFGPSYVFAVDIEKAR